MIFPIRNLVEHRAGVSKNERIVMFVPVMTIKNGCTDIVFVQAYFRIIEGVVTS